MGWIVLVLAVFPVVFLLLFLGGIASAALEIRKERKAGLEPTRPAWDNRNKRQALGGFRAAWRVSIQKARHGKMVTCWCGCGPIVEFPALDDGTPAGLGCSAWESGEPRAILLHDAAGGYARTPNPSSVLDGAA